MYFNEFNGFGVLQNASATYKRMIMKIFGHLMGSTMEVYIDDMVIKSKKERDHLRDLVVVFKILKKHKLRQNATKCAFGVSLGKFLRHLMTWLVIKANPEYIVSIRDFERSKLVKEVQKLIGLVATLNRFIIKSLDKCRPFFQLHKNNKFE